MKHRIWVYCGSDRDEIGNVFAIGYWRMKASSKSSVSTQKHQRSKTQVTS